MYIILQMEETSCCPVLGWLLHSPAGAGVAKVTYSEHSTAVPTLHLAHLQIHCISPYLVFVISRYL